MQAQRILGTALWGLEYSVLCVVLVSVVPAGSSFGFGLI